MSRFDLLLSFVSLALPKPPEDLTIESRTQNEITLKWQLVPLATSYQIEFKYPNNKTETFFKSGGFQLALIDELEPNTSYSVRIRSETLTGLSNLTEPLEIKTLGLGLYLFCARLDGNKCTIEGLKFSSFK